MRPVGPRAGEGGPRAPARPGAAGERPAPYPPAADPAPRWLSAGEPGPEGRAQRGALDARAAGDAGRPLPLVPARQGTPGARPQPPGRLLLQRGAAPRAR